MTMCFAVRGGGGKGSQCTVHTNKSVDTEEQIFDTLLKVKINYCKNTFI
jgi:hypothetical protein